MKLHEFAFELPPELIASHPHDHREEARMMVVNRQTGTIEHKQFKDLTSYFNEGDLFVMNDTKVFQARLYGQKEKTGAKIEVFLLRELNAQYHLWDVNVDPARKIRVGNKLYFGDSDLVAEVIDNTTSRGRTIRFSFDGTAQEFAALIDQIGETPLPYNILEQRPLEEDDRERFQTVYAKHVGAVTVPAAGLHIDKHFIKRMEIAGIESTYLTLHVGLGSYRPVEAEDLNKHKPDAEPFNVTDATAKRINRALDERKKICIIGASTMRAVESSITSGTRLKVMDQWTDKFIYPNYEFRLGASFVTNFMLPMTMPKMMAHAFGGHELIKKAYQIAVEEKYKFHVFGDCMFIL